MIIASRIVWGFAVATPPAEPSGQWEIVHVPGLVDAVQYCRIALEDREVFVVFLNGAAPGDARVHALAAHFPEAALAVVTEDSRDLSHVLGLGAPADAIAAAVGIAMYNGSLDGPLRLFVDVDGTRYVVAPEFHDRQWFCQAAVV